MPLFYPDILKNNNSNYPLVDITEIRGNSYPLGDISETGSIPPFKRNIGQLVFASSSQQFYAYKGQTTSSVDWNTTSNWIVISGVDTSMFVTTASFNSFTGSYNTGSFSGSFIGTADTASFVTASNVYGPYGSNSIISASYAVTASYVDLSSLTLNSESLGSVPIVVVAATTAVLPRTPTYNNGTGGVGAFLTASLVGTLGNIDGVSLTAGDTLLVKNQAAQLQNGVYEVVSTGSATTRYLLSRSLSSDETSEFDPQVILIASGSANRGLVFSQNTNNPIVGTSPIVYLQQIGVFLTQIGTGTQAIYQIPWYTGTARQLSRGSDNFKYINVTSGTTVTTSSLVLTGSLFVTGGISQSGGSGHVLTYNTQSGRFSFTASSAFGGGTTTVPGGPYKSIQFNNEGAFSGSSNFIFDSASNSVILTGSMYTTGSNTLVGNTILSGTLQIQGEYPPSAGSASVSIVGNVDLNGYLRFDPVTSNIDTSISASYIYVSGSTQDLYFSQNGSGYANVTRLRWLEGNLYTGLLHGGALSQVNSNTYRVASGSGIIVNLNASLNDDPYPTIQFLEWGNLTKTIDALSSSFDQQFIAISSSNQIHAQGTPYFNGEVDTYIPIGIVLHQNRSTINGVKTQPSLAYGWK